MGKELKIGILEISLSWQMILEQIGVSYSLVPDNKDLSPYSFNIIVINRVVSGEELEKIKEYVNNGGAIIDEGYCIDKLINGKIEKKKINYLIPDQLPFKIPLGVIDIYSNVLTFSKAQYLEKTLFIDNIGSGLVSFLGLDINTLLFDSRSKRKEFYSILARFPNEETSTVSKGDITRLIFILMRHLHTSRNIPFIHKWFFPGKAENVFLFRIDSDYGRKHQIKQWYEIGKSNSIKFTWFLHVSAHRDWLNTFKDFNDHEIAVHGYDHFASNNYHVYKQDIQRAVQILQENGFTPFGYASPYGIWNRAVSSVCEDFDFNYSSEFSYIYDSLSIYPVINNKKSALLQIPVHPICIGTLQNAKANEKEMVDYFTTEFQRQISKYNPLIFYDHVTHNNSDVLIEIFHYIQTLNIPSLTFNEFSDWWKKRENTVFSASTDSSNQINLSPSNTDEELSFAIWISDDSHILTTKTVTDLSSHPIKKTNYQLNYDLNILKKIRRFNWRVQKYSLLNKYMWRKYK